MISYVVRVLPFGGPATQVPMSAPDAVTAICRALTKLCPDGAPHGFVAVVSRADDGHGYVACKCAADNEFDGQVTA